MTRREGDPAPKNLDAMTAAYAAGDAVAIARERAIYNQQLIDAGKAPLYEQPTLPDWNDR